MLTTDATGEPFDYSIFATAYRLSLTAPSGPRTTLFPWLPGGLIHTKDDGLLLAADSAPAVIRQALSRDNALTTIGGHSDEIDVQVAGAASMCGLRGWKPGAPGQVVPRCVQRSWCHRRRVPLSAALRAPEIIEPDAIRSRVLLLDICFGMPLVDRLYHRSFSILNAILTTSQFGAMVTNCGVAFLDMDNTERVGDELRHKRGIGRGLVLHVSAARARGDRLILIGDPALVLNTRARLIRASRRTDPAPIAGQLLFSLQHPTRSLLAAAFKEGTRKGTVSHPAAAIDAFLDWMDGRGNIDQTWASRGGLSRPSVGPSCAGCGARTRLFASPPRVLVHRRHLVICPVCGIVADRRRTETVLLSHGPTSVYALTSAFRQSVSAAALRFEKAGRQTLDEPYVFAAVRWPVAKKGVPQRSISAPATAPPGINRITGIFLHDEDITVLTLLRVV